MTESLDGPAERISPKPGVPLVRALDRGVALLRSFTPLRPRLPLAELARASELDRGTARRLLHTLQLAGLVEHDERTGLYSLGVGVLELASAVEIGRDLREVAAPYLVDLANTTGAVAFLWTYSEGLALCLDRVKAEIPGIEATWFAIGARAQLNCGGGPKALLAFLPAHEREMALKREMLGRSPASVTDRDRLRAQAEHDRAVGWTLAVDDFVIGLSGLGVPIFDTRRQLIGALSISGLTSTFVGPPEPPYIRLLQKVAGEIGAKVIAPERPGQ